MQLYFVFFPSPDRQLASLTGFLDGPTCLGVSGQFVWGVTQAAREAGRGCCLVLRKRPTGALGSVDDGGCITNGGLPTEKKDTGRQATGKLRLTTVRRMENEGRGRKSKVWKKLRKESK